MTIATNFDYAPIARQVYDSFLVSIPGVPVEGLFEKGGQYFIVSPATQTEFKPGQTVQDWFDNSLRPLGMGIFLVADRPAGSQEVTPRSASELIDCFGAVRTVQAWARDLSLLLPAAFPLAGVTVENKVLVILVSRPLEGSEQTTLLRVISQLGCSIPHDVRLSESSTQGLRGSAMPLELAPSRFRRELPSALRHFLEADEDYWRQQYARALTGHVSSDEVLGTRRSAGTSSCLVSTVLPPHNIRAYLSLYQKVILVLPLKDRVDDTLQHLGVTRRDLAELLVRDKVRFIAPQSVDRYDHELLAQLLEVDPTMVIGSRRLAVAVHANQAARNPLLVLPGTAFDRRAVLRALTRLAESDRQAGPVFAAAAEGLAQAWPMYEYCLHVRGAMTSVGGPLARISAALAERLTGKDYFIELGSAAACVEWASALGAHFAPFETDGYSEVGHAEFLLALHSGVPRNAPIVASASSFRVAEELLVIDNDVDLIDFVTALGSGDMARFRGLVHGITAPGRSAEEVRELIDAWNRQARAYERKPDRLRSMGLAGFLLGTTAKAIGAPDLVSLSAAVLPLLPAALTYAQEDVAGSSTSIGSAIDSLNAKLAGVQRDAVLLARLKKLIRGMK